MSTMYQSFSVDVTTGKSVKPKQSGRCWMFAALNTFRHKMLNAFNLKDFELSQNHTFSGINMKKPTIFMKMSWQQHKSLYLAAKVAFLAANTPTRWRTMGYDRVDLSKIWCRAKSSDARKQ